MIIFYLFSCGLETCDTKQVKSSSIMTLYSFSGCNPRKLFNIVMLIYKQLLKETVWVDYENVYVLIILNGEILCSHSSLTSFLNN